MWVAVVKVIGSAAISKESMAALKLLINRTFGSTCFERAKGFETYGRGSIVGATVGKVWTTVVGAKPCDIVVLSEGADRMAAMIAGSTDATEYKGIVGLFCGASIELVGANETFVGALVSREATVATAAVVTLTIRGAAIATGAVAVVSRGVKKTAGLETTTGATIVSEKFVERGTSGLSGRSALSS